MSDNKDSYNGNQTWKSQPSNLNKKTSSIQHIFAYDSVGNYFGGISRTWTDPIDVFIKEAGGVAKNTKKIISLFNNYFQ